MKKERDGKRSRLSRWDFLKICGLFAVALVLGSHIPVTFAQETYPAGKINWIVGFQPGGGEDIMARGVAPFLEKYLKAVSPNPNKVEVQIKNIPGGGEMRAMSELYHGKPDGYTIANGGEKLHTNTILGTLGFDIFEVTFMGRLASSNKIIVTGSRSNVHTWDDVVNASKKAPVKLAISGFGGSNHVAAIMVMDTIGLPLKPVIFDGTAGCNAALIRGDVPIGIASEDSVRHLIEAKELRVVLTFTETTIFPGVKNVKEIGFPELTEPIKSQRYMIAPPGLPANIKKILEDSLKKALADKEFIAWNQKANISFSPVIGPDVDKLVKNIHSVYKSKEKVLKEYLSEKKS